MNMSIGTPVLGLDKGKLSLDNNIDIHIAHRWTFVANYMLCFYLCTLVKRVARVYSKFALKLQAAPVFPGSVGLQQHKKTSTLQCLGREQHISKII